MENLSSLGLADVLAAAVIVLGAVRGYFRGLSGELARVIGLAVALLLGLRFYRPIGEWLGERVELGGASAEASAFVLTVAAGLVCLFIVRCLLRNVMKVVFNEKLEKTGGVLVGMVRAAVFVLSAFLVLNLWPSDGLNRMFGEDSLIGRQVVKLLPGVREELGGRIGEWNGPPRGDGEPRGRNDSNSIER